MGSEVQLISDGQGLAVIGEPAAVERFLASEGLPSKDLGLRRLQHLLTAGAGGLQAGSGIAASASRWVKLTPESVKWVQDLIPTDTPGVFHAVAGTRGHVEKWLQIVQGPGSFVTNPAVLAGAAGIMSQLAMQQTMDEITDYLATIDAKLDDVLRAQQDAVLADMVGVDLVIDEAMTIRQHVGRVSETTWSKVQVASMALARTQGYALRQLDALADKIERKTKMADIAAAASEAGTKVQEWLAVLARCFQLQDAVAVLELDRVLDASPDELDRHRLALQAARERRVDLISRSTGHLVARLDEAASGANSKVLLHPTKAPLVVRSSHHVAGAVESLDVCLGIERGHDAVANRRWLDAAVELKDMASERGAGYADAVTEAKDKAWEAGSERAEAAFRAGSEAVDRARSAKGRLTAGLAARVAQRRASEDDDTSTTG